MKYDIILAGVGGQGVLSISAIIASSAMEEGLHVKQSEVHGMSQRGGEVQANLRLSDHPIESDLIAHGTAALILSMEPLEGLRYLDFLARDGSLVTAVDPIIDISDYPPVEDLLAKIRALPRAVLVEADRLAREAGSAQAVNMVMAGAAAPLLPIRTETMERHIRRIFGAKGERIVEINLRAFEAGRGAVRT